MKNLVAVLVLFASLSIGAEAKPFHGGALRRVVHYGIVKPAKVVHHELFPKVLDQGAKVASYPLRHPKKTARKVF